MAGSILAYSYYVLLISDRDSYQSLQRYQRQAPNMALPLPQLHPHGHMGKLPRRCNGTGHQRNGLKRIRHPSRPSQSSLGIQAPQATLRSTLIRQLVLQAELLVQRWHPHGLHRLHRQKPNTFHHRVCIQKCLRYKSAVYKQVRDR